MNELVTQSKSEEWHPTVAHVVSCRRTLGFLFHRSSLFGEWAESPEYIVCFEYKAMGSTYSGTYKSPVPRRCGHSLQILYDPQNPEVNTGSDSQYRRSTRIAIRIAAILLGLGIAWLCF